MSSSPKHPDMVRLATTLPGSEPDLSTRGPLQVLCLLLRGGSGGLVGYLPVRRPGSNHFSPPARQPACLVCPQLLTYKS